MSFDIDPDALASALPAGLGYDIRHPGGKVVRWTCKELAQFQAERLAQSGYRLVHDEYGDSALAPEDGLGHAPQLDGRCTVCGHHVVPHQSFAEHTAEVLALVTDPEVVADREPGLTLDERGMWKP